MRTRCIRPAWWVVGFRRHFLRRWTTSRWCDANWRAPQSLWDVDTDKWSTRFGRWFDNPLSTNLTHQSPKIRTGSISLLTHFLRRKWFPVLCLPRNESESSFLPSPCRVWWPSQKPNTKNVNIFSFLFYNFLFG